MLRVYLKELLELTRDRKTLIFTILLPTLIMPVILIGFFVIVSKIGMKAKEEVLDFAIIGSNNYSQIEQQMVRETDDEGNELNFNLVKIDEDADIGKLIDDEVVRFVLVIPENTEADIKAGKSAKIIFKYNDSFATSGLMFIRVVDALESLKELELVERYASMGMSKEEGLAFSKPFELEQESTANDREAIGEKFGALLPYILILVGLSGAMYPALDLGVGEKERGTLETLLLTPVPRFSLVFAKFGVIFTTSFLSIFLSLISFSLTTVLAGSTILPMLGSVANETIDSVMAILADITIVDVLLMFSMLVPIAGIFASVLLSVSIYARTFKEAQNYMSPFMMLVFLPLILALLPGVKLDWVWAAVPITNVALAIKEIFKGTIDLGMLAVIFVSTTLIAGALLALCNWWFQREQVLFRN